MTCNCQFRHMFLMYPNLLREHSHLLFSSFLTLIHRSIYIHTHTLPPVSLSILIVVLFLQSPLSTVLPPVSFVCVKKKNPSLQSPVSIVHFFDPSVLNSVIGNRTEQHTPLLFFRKGA